MEFPTIKSYDLNQKLVQLPYDLVGKYNLLILSYGAWHLWQSESWLPFAQRLKAAYDQFDYYAVSSVIQENKFDRLAQPRPEAGVIAKDHILTIRQHHTQLMAALGIGAHLNIVTLLVRQDGHVAWCNTGAWSPDKAESLDRVLLNLMRLHNDIDGAAL